MPLWTWFGLRRGQATMPWPQRAGSPGQDGVLGMPRFEPERCAPGCDACAAACPTEAIMVEKDGEGGERLRVDYGSCVVCQLCVEACPAGAATASFDWAFGVRDRSDLRLSTGEVARRD